MFRFVEATGAFELEAGLFSARGIVLTIRTADLVLRSDRLDFSADGANAAAARHDDLKVRIRRDHDRATLIELTNQADHPVRLENLTLTFAPACFDWPRAAREHRHLVHTADFEPATGVKPVHRPAEWCDVNPPSGLMTIYSHDASGEALLIGALPPFGGGFVRIVIEHDSLHMEGDFGFCVTFDHRQTIAPGATVRTSPLLILGRGPGEALLERYRKVFASRNPRAKRPPVTGWNSWDYYLGAVRREDMDENAAACRKTFGDRVQYIVIDEGWEKQWGVWEAGWKFTEGLTDFCRHVRDAGFAPGVWTAPLTVNRYTPLYRLHPDWFVSDARGQVYWEQLSYGQMATLDVTHPQVQEHLRCLYRRLRDDGFEYFKIDFAHMILKGETFHDPQVGRAELLRILFRLIRESIGDDAYLLACGSPAESVTGIVDAIRTSEDVHHFWGHVVQNARTNFAHMWMHGAVGNADPDFVIVRCTQTSDDPHMYPRMPQHPFSKGGHWCDGAAFDVQEARVLALSAYLTGGDIIFGDAIGQLNEMGLSILRQVLPPLDRPARRLNLFEPDGEETPVLAAEQDDQRIVVVFNLTDSPRRKTLRAGLGDNPVNARDFWTDEPLRIREGQDIDLPPRSVWAARVPIATT